ncbi:MAG: hypothetical protein PHI40_07110 [Caldisericia bacterium]|nr:hypothetical protein [Caldisericia bacterium]MDD4615151.1 hypothetical protein [Caldisericia bacterium]
MKKTKKTPVSSFLLCFGLVFSIVFSGSVSVAFAWEQDAHKIINKKAIEHFESYEKHADKYFNNHVDLKIWTKSPTVLSSSKTAKYYEQDWRAYRSSQHIIHGGYSADEPHLYVSVKHFYNPIASNSPHQLTDLNEYHGIGWEAIPATDWALTRPENPYTLVRALQNYKKSMEIPYNASVSTIATTGDFRDFAGEPTNVEEMRKMYAGKALRGLGEVLHLVADMTQPAHVRNDAHPKWEITESAVTKSAAATLVNEPRRDGVNVPALGKTTGNIMRNLAYWTNRNFYSEDTMYDPVAEVSPKNKQKPYDSPIFSHFYEKEYKKYPTWFKNYPGLEVPMFRKERDWTFINYRYIITPEFAVEQGKILLPLAASTCARVIDLFWPTLQLKQDVVEVEVAPEILKKAEELKILEVKQYEANIQLQHPHKQDPQWAEYGLQIHYAGPGELWRIRGSRHRKITDVEFINGSVVACQDPETGEMTEGKPQLILPLGSNRGSSLSGPKIDYTVEMEDALYVKVLAGVQQVKSIPYLFELEKPSILVDTEKKNILPGDSIDMEATIENPPERFRLDWTIENLSQNKEDITPPISISTRDTVLNHEFQKEGVHRVTVQLYDKKRNMVVAEDYMDVMSEFVDLSGAWNIVLTVEKESAVFRKLIQSFLKGLFSIFKPLLEASGETADDSVIDQFTFVGSTIEYNLQLQKTKEDEIYYEGNLTFTGSNTGYFSASDYDFAGAILTMEKKHLVLYVLSVNDYGQTVKTPFLRSGELIDIRSLQGEFKTDALALQGTWKATR